MKYKVATDLCLRNIRTDPGLFYGPANGLPLGAGLLVRDCVLALPHPTEKRFLTGIGTALILTHECDIDQNNDGHFNDLMLVCPIIALDDFCSELEQEEGIGSWGGILAEIARDNVYRVFYLPPPPSPLAGGELEGGGIVYLNHISCCRASWIAEPLSQAICSLSARGLRAFDANLQNHLFRMKAVPLAFSR